MSGYFFVEWSTMPSLYITQCASASIEISLIYMLKKHCPVRARHASEMTEP